MAIEAKLRSPGKRSCVAGGYQRFGGPCFLHLQGTFLLFFRKEPVHLKSRHQPSKLHCVKFQKILIFNKRRISNWFYTQMYFDLSEPLEENNVYIHPI
jgi:hypothetical protein